MKKTNLMVCAMLIVLLKTILGLASLTDGLVAYYPFNGNANDESGNGNDGTVTGAALTADRFGNPNSAYSFDGINDIIEVSHSSSLNITSAISLCAWVYPFELSHYTAIVWKRDDFVGPPMSDCYGLRTNQSPPDEVTLSFGPNQWIPTTGFALQTGHWTYF